MAPEVTHSVLLGVGDLLNVYTFSGLIQSVLKLFRINPGDIGCIVVPTKDFSRVWEALEKTVLWFGGGGRRRAWRHGDVSGTWQTRWTSCLAWLRHMWSDDSGRWWHDIVGHDGYVEVGL